MRSYFASFMTKEALEQFVKVGLVGIANTVVSFLLFNIFLWILRCAMRSRQSLVTR